jgi:hypothetical protein
VGRSVSGRTFGRGREASWRAFCFSDAEFAALAAERINLVTILAGAAACHTGCSFLKPIRRRLSAHSVLGAAARGSDNTTLNWGQLLAESWVPEKHDFFLVVPQCPRSSGWVESAWSGGTKESEALRLALELVSDGLPKEFHIDPKRRYLTGVSMGGHAVWTVMIRHPGLFAAAVPVCSGGRQRASRMQPRNSLCDVHSDDDHLVRCGKRGWSGMASTAAPYTPYTGLRHALEKARESGDVRLAVQQRLPWCHASRTMKRVRY